MGVLDVSNLVGKDGGKVVLGPAETEHPSGDKDEPAGGGKGIDLIGVQKEEVVAPEGLRFL